MHAGRLLSILAFLIAIMGGYGAYWWWSAQTLADGLENWRQAQAARGYRVLYEGPEIGGFPLRLTARFERPEIAAPEGWRWAGPALTGSAAPWAPFEISFSAPGRHLLVLPDDSGQTEAYDIDAGRADGQLSLAADGQPAQLEVDLGDLALRGDSVSELRADRLWATAGPLQPANTERPQALDLSVSLSGVTLPPEMPTVFGQEIAHLGVTSTLEGPLLSAGTREALQQWRAAQGRLQLHGVGLNWGPLDYDGRGELTLDAQLRPQGRLNGALAGYNEAIDALQEHRLIAPNAAAGSKLLLSALAQSDASRGRRVVELPVTLRDGRFFLGPLALFPLAPVL